MTTFAPGWLFGICGCRHVVYTSSRRHVYRCEDFEHQRHDETITVSSVTPIVDAVAKRLYHNEVGKLVSRDLYLGDPVTLIDYTGSPGTTILGGLSVDASGSHIYFHTTNTTLGERKLHRCDPDGTNDTVLKTLGSTSFGSITFTGTTAVSEADDILFWGEIEPVSGGGMSRLWASPLSSFGGSAILAQTSFGVDNFRSYVTSSIDLANQKLWFTGAKLPVFPGSVVNCVRRCDFDGSNLEDMFEHTVPPSPTPVYIRVEVVNAHGLVYFGDRGTGSLSTQGIHRCNLDGSGHVLLIKAANINESASGDSALFALGEGFRQFD